MAPKTVNSRSEAVWRSNCTKTDDHVAFYTVMDDISARNQIFLLLAKKELCAAKGCTGSLVALKGYLYICVAFRLHIII